LTDSLIVLMHVKDKSSLQNGLTGIVVTFSAVTLYFLYHFAAAGSASDTDRLENLYP
jgi:hypothetical protein